MLEKLKKYIPEKTHEDVLALIKQYPLRIKITKPRKTKLGDYRPLNKGQSHQITVNGDLNQYAFLVTFLHELAHLETFVEYSNRVKPHGTEWKRAFKAILDPFLQKGIFPHDLYLALQKYIQNPAASCSDPQLMAALRKYDTMERPPFLEELPVNSVFKWRNGRLFKKGQRLRKRFKCQELKSKKYYLFHPSAEVLPLDQ